MLADDIIRPIISVYSAAAQRFVLWRSWSLQSKQSSSKSKSAWSSGCVHCDSRSMVRVEGVPTISQSVLGISTQLADGGTHKVRFKKNVTDIDELDSRTRWLRELKQSLFIFNNTIYLIKSKISLWSNQLISTLKVPSGEPTSSDNTDASKRWHGDKVSSFNLLPFLQS